MFISVQIQRGGETELKSVQVPDNAETATKDEAFAKISAWLDEQHKRG